MSASISQPSGDSIHFLFVSMKPLRALIPLILTVSTNVFGATFNEEFAKIKTSGSSEKIQTFIADSYESNKDNPEYFISAANYWWSISKEIQISTKPSEKDDFSVADQKTGKEVGSISSVGRTNPEIPKKAIELLREGFKRNPFRFDIAMGLAYMLRDEKEFDECSKILHAILKTASKEPGKILWKNGAPPDKPINLFVPETLQGYTSGFYKMETAQGDQLCDDLCKAIIATYPDHPYAYNVLAALCSAHKDEKGCLGYLHAALDRSPEDTLILFNIADAYRRSGDKISAKHYYELIISSKASENDKNDAKEALSQL